MLIKDKSLTSEVIQIIRHNATEPPHAVTELSKNKGTCLCRACGLSLFRTTMQFQSFCGWSSFDEIIENSVATQPDPV